MSIRGDLSEKDQDEYFESQISAVRGQQVFFDVFPFYISWFATAMLMVERKYGRSATCMLIFALGYLEFQVRVQYGSTDSVLTAVFDSCFPKTWTIGQSCQVARGALPIFLMLLVTALDLSLDAKARDEDRFENLKICLAHQEKILEMC